MRIMVTGATGTVGAPMVLGLIENGHEIVALVREKNGIPPEQRLRDALQKSTLPETLSVLSGDIEDPDCGIPDEKLIAWQGTIDVVLHAAASIKFDDTDGVILRTNVQGTQHVLDLAHRVGATQFHYVSTAYVVGDAPILHENDHVGGRPRNKYEASKMQAEKLVRGFAGQTSIYRIPIVVGDSRTGETNSFNGYYGFLAPLWQLKRSLLEKWEKNPDYGRKDNIFLDEESYVHIPLSIPCSLAGPLNLVPIDWLTDMLVELAQKPAEGKTFHVTHPNPRGVRETMMISLECLGLKGIACGEYPPEDRKGLVGRFQQAILKGVKPYSPYILKHEEVFGNQVTVQTLGKKWTPPPDIGPEVIGRLLRFAVQEKFGRS